MYYLDNNRSLRQVAKKYRISTVTLWRWVKWFNSGGVNALDREHMRIPWNKISKEIQLKVASIKEADPRSTISDALNKLQTQDIEVSRNAIWTIWREYGLISDNNISLARDALFSLTSKVPSPIINEAQTLLRSFGKIPFPEYRKKARSLRIRLEKNKLHYSALKLSITEVISLTWLGRVQEQVELIQHIKKWLPVKGDVLLKYMLAVGEGIACAQTMRLKEARQCVRVCQDLLLRNSINAPDLWRELANLNQHIGEYARAMNIVHRHVRKKQRKVDRSVKAVFMVDHALLLVTAGQYDKCLQVIENIDRSDQMVDSLVLMFKAQCRLAQGSVREAQEYARLAIEKAKKDQISALLNVASIVFASVIAALGDIRKAKSMINRLNPLLKKTGMIKDLNIREMIASAPKKRISMIKSDKNMHPVYRLIMLLKQANSQRSLTILRQAYQYAKIHGFKGIFYRSLIFFPELTRQTLRKARSFELPPLFYSLPGFSLYRNAFRINYLGPIQIMHKQQIKVKLPPKDLSFLIFLARSHHKQIPLSEVYQWFWPDSKNASQNLAHLLVRVRKALNISPHSLFMRHNDLICRCTFVSDLDEFKNAVIQARALERLDQYRLAEKEYCHAFALFREKPFSDMYDAYSEQERLHILFDFDEIAEHFIGKYVNNTSGKLKRSVKKTLLRILNTAPHINDCLSEKMRYN